ncbi:MAG: hypothetical protein O7D34_00460 [Ignavibacteria bacterium]|nr:hypothetical protein [Ignavibacteria bacterium]
MQNNHCLKMFGIIVIVSVVLVSCARVNDDSETKAIVRGYMEEIVNKGNFACMGGVLLRTGCV